MGFLREDSRKYTLVKTISWYVVHITWMIAIGYVLTGSFAIGITIAVLETIGESVLYYTHERTWLRVRKRFE